MLIQTNETDFDAVFSIMEAAFPPDERRTYAEQKALLARDKYQLYVAKESGVVVAFLAVWALSTPFIEHFAVAETHRNSGLGGKLLDEAIALLGGACLEAEPPCTDIAKRRIAFYNRHGLVLNEYPYVQPAITAGRNPVPLMIMTYGAAIGAEEFSMLDAEIKKEVYANT